jgi:hypothetical protein
MWVWGGADVGIEGHGVGDAGTTFHLPCMCIFCVGVVQTLPIVLSLSAAEVVRY